MSKFDQAQRSSREDLQSAVLRVGFRKDYLQEDDRAGLPLESVRVPVPRPMADQVLLRVAASSLNPLEYKLAELNFLGRTPPVILGLDLSGIVVAKGSAAADPGRVRSRLLV